MRNLVLLLCLSLLSLGIASADLIPCTVSNLGTGGSLGSSTVVVCGSLTFDNFVVSDPTNGAPGIIDLLGTPEYDSGTGEAYLNFNPNLSGFGDELFTFAVVGGVRQLDMSVGGSDATIFEEACANPVPLSGSLLGLCTDPTGSFSVAPLGSLTVSSGEPAQPILSAPFASTSPIYIFKDINEDGGLLTEFSQSFSPTIISTPEPSSTILIGSGLLAVGLWRRRSRRG